MKKNFLLGLIIGSIIFAVPSAFAASTYEALKATFPIFIDGEECKNANNAMVIDGTTYLPLKYVCNLLNVEIKWNDELNRVEINTNTNKSSKEKAEENIEEFSDDYWLNYYEEYYGEMFAELYGKDIENTDIYEDADENLILNDDTEENSSETTTSEQEVVITNTTTYVGNKNTKKLHVSTCAAAIKLLENNKVYFSSIDEAKGYTKCQLCNP